MLNLREPNSTSKTCRLAPLKLKNSLTSLHSIGINLRVRYGLARSPGFSCLAGIFKIHKKRGVAHPPSEVCTGSRLLHLCINTILEQTKFEPKAGPTLGWLCVDPSWIFRKVLGGPVHARTFSPAVDKVIQMLLSNAPVFCHCPVT